MTPENPSQYELLYEALAHWSLWSASAVEEREERCRSLFAAGITAQHVDVLSLDVQMADNPIAVLAKILSDPPTAYVRAAALLRHREPKEPAISHANGCGDVLGKAAEQAAAAFAMTPREVDAAKWDDAIYEAVACARIPIVCWRTTTCERNEKQPPCCIKTWLSRNGVHAVPISYVWDAIDRHCHRNPDRVWTRARLQEYFSASTSHSRRKRLAQEVNEEAATRREIQDAERAVKAAQNKRNRKVKP